jgi:hypothetical protein
MYLSPFGGLKSTVYDDNQLDVPLFEFSCVFRGHVLLNLERRANRLEHDDSAVLFGTFDLVQELEAFARSVHKQRLNLVSKALVLVDINMGVVRCLDFPQFDDIQ